MKSDFLIALTQLAAERHLPREQVLGAIEVALASAFKKDNISKRESGVNRFRPEHLCNTQPQHWGRLQARTSL